MIGALFGAIGGYIYWYFWGCTDNCTIRSVWWRMSLWGAFMGALLLSSAIDFKEKKNTSQD